MILEKDIFQLKIFFYDNKKSNFSAGPGDPDLITIKALNHFMSPSF